MGLARKRQVKTSGSNQDATGLQHLVGPGLLHPQVTKRIEPPGKRPREAYRHVLDDDDGGWKVSRQRRKYLLQRRRTTRRATQAHDRHCGRRLRGFYGRTSRCGTSQDRRLLRSRYGWGKRETIPAYKCRLDLRNQILSYLNNVQGGVRHW